MHWYPDTIKDWFSGLFSGYLWHGSRTEKTVYLTFDDGPHPQVTPFVINLLNQYEFQATFFCIGDCVNRHPDIYKELLKSGNGIGNHTFNHLNSWKTSSNVYLENIEKAGAIINSRLFRPPYGRITASIAQKIKAQDYTIVMWDVLSGDFDQNRTALSCLKNLKKNTRNGSIIVFHDSEKAFKKLKIILPDYFKYLQKNGYSTSIVKHTAVVR